MRTALLLLLLMPFACLAQKKKQHSNYSPQPVIRLLTYGLPAFHLQNAENVVSARWGIQYFAVAGCVVSEELVDSVERFNKKADRQVRTRYGKNWNKKFWQEVEEEYLRQKGVDSMARIQPYTVKTHAEMEAEGNGLHYYIKPLPDSDDVYEVQAQGWGKWEGTSGWLHYYTMHISRTTLQVRLVSDRRALMRSE